MNRRGFLGILSKGSAAAVVAPTLFCTPVPMERVVFDHTVPNYLGLSNGAVGTDGIIALIEKRGNVYNYQIPKNFSSILRSYYNVTGDSDIPIYCDANQFHFVKNH